MENLGSSKKNFALPSKQELEVVFGSLKRREWVLLGVLVLVFAVSGLYLLETLNRSFMVRVPMSGGMVIEGVVGTPRFVNPILAFGEADKDLVNLVYSGLMRKNEDGTLAPDLAESYVTSENGLSYTFTLRDKIFFHDGAPVTLDDIIFTINQVKDSLIKSPKKSNWDGVEIEKLNEKQITFTLKQRYTPFLENTTLGILPKHVWNNASPIELNEANIQPIGSGPYQIKDIVRDDSGPIRTYELVAFKKFALGEPYVKNLKLNFYQNEEELLVALKRGAIEQASSITPESAEKLKKEGYQIVSATLPRVFGLFFNQSQNQLFVDKAIIRAINRAIDKERIVNNVLFGFGQVIDDPIPPNMIGYPKFSNTDIRTREDVILAIRDDLAKAGWVVGESGYLEKTFTENKKKIVKMLEFAISTSNTPELAKAATLIQEDSAALGIRVEVKTFDIGNLNQAVIRPRKYDALLFGQIINNESDLLAFWHSSQIKDPGLNVAIYTNAKVDKILEEALTVSNPSERVKKYAEFESEIKKDTPAVFLYSPDFIYAVSEQLQGLAIEHLNSPSARFLSVHKWYINTDNIWKIFSPR